jgi:hypothetical protein
MLADGFHVFHMGRLFYLEIMFWPHLRFLTYYHHY